MPKVHTCSQCGEEKQISEYYKHSGRSTGFAVPCKECHKLNMNAKYDPASQKTYNRKRNLKRYGLTLEEYELMLIKQDFSCAICDIHISELDYNLCIDHDHETGLNRKLLCRHCNSGLGMFFDSTKLLEKAIEYLEAHNS